MWTRFPVLGKQVSAEHVFLTRKQVSFEHIFPDFSLFSVENENWENIGKLELENWKNNLPNEYNLNVLLGN